MSRHTAGRFPSTPSILSYSLGSLFFIKKFHNRKLIDLLLYCLARIFTQILYHTVVIWCWSRTIRDIYRLTAKRQIWQHREALNLSICWKYLPIFTVQRSAITVVIQTMENNQKSKVKNGFNKREFSFSNALPSFRNFPQFLKHNVIVGIAIPLKWVTSQSRVTPKSFS